MECIEALDLDVVGLVETGVLHKDKEIFQRAIDPETHQVYQASATNDGGAKVQEWGVELLPPQLTLGTD